MDSPPAELEGYSAMEDESHCASIKPDYFALYSAFGRPLPPTPVPDSDSSDNPSFVDPDSSSRFVDPPPAIWSDSSSSSLHSEPGIEDSEEIDPNPPSSTGVGSDPGSGSGRSGANEGEKKGAGAWWKLPLELVRFHALRMRPVWIAAAIVGVVMLGRKLNKMRHKGRSVPLGVSLDVKKTSQFMARAARLSEAFSIVRRASIVRPSLPASGVTPWPVLGLL